VVVSRRRSEQSGDEERSRVMAHGEVYIFIAVKTSTDYLLNLDHRHDVVSSSPEDGYSVWNRVATAASMLTVSVSKAWAANATNAGEGLSQTGLPMTCTE
jgi:hypothetical protein